MNKWLLIAGIALVLIVGGCVSSQPNPTDNTLNNPTTTTMVPHPNAGGALVPTTGSTDVTNPATNPPSTGTSGTGSDGAMHDDNAAMTTPPAMHDDNAAMGENPNAMMGGSVSYSPYTKAAFDAAVAKHQNIFLEFYANWCPICETQEMPLKDGFARIHSDKLVAFRVNYIDSDTDGWEQQLATKYNIYFEHTHLIISWDGQQLWRSQALLSADDVVEKVGAFAK